VWGPSLLAGDDTIGPGRVFAVTLPAGRCRHDFRVVYANGREQKINGVETCPAPQRESYRPPQDPPGVVTPCYARPRGGAATQTPPGSAMPRPAP
jgi:hypothetical protein